MYRFVFLRFFLRFFRKIDLPLKFQFSTGIIFSVVGGLVDEFSLRYEHRINGLSLGYQVDGSPSATSFWSIWSRGWQ